MSHVIAILCGDMEVSTVNSKPGYLSEWAFDDVTTFVSDDINEECEDTSHYISSTRLRTMDKSPEIRTDETCLEGDLDKKLARKGMHPNAKALEVIRSQTHIVVGASELEKEGACRVGQEQEGSTADMVRVQKLSMRDGDWLMDSSRGARVRAGFWSPDGLSYIASRVGKSLGMDRITEDTYRFGVGRIGFARVLVEVDAAQKFPEWMRVWMPNEVNDEP
ncbi:hypothetical protein Pint_04994 [Pistacia integerrima]|uniref:Uncharacterized protein n=1 Tax=Pistacia integerrima TaxID=434235 RepID=A0ACC0Z5F2_9ROSI|nr:hypothetical protein Pint_04994 [Pistacia integerrima]